MSSVLRYGADASVSLKFPDGVLLAECGTPQAPPLDDPEAAAGKALREPLEYPPLALCTTPGDRVVLALDERLPQGGQIAAAVIQALASAGVQSDGITVLRTARDADAGLGDPGPWLPEGLRASIALAAHDPDDREAIAYLAATDEGEPILLNRLLTDADLVLPIGCVRQRGAAGYHGVHSPIFPNFSDRRTMLRFLSRESDDRRERGKKDLIEEADHVGWLLGVAFTIQVVPGPGDRLLHVLAGEAGEVSKRGQELYREAWRCSVPRRASLVVAAIEGGSEQQTWENVGRALAAAGRLVEDDGAIAICSEIASDPGPALAQLRTGGGREYVKQTIRRSHPPDALSAAQVLQALDRVRVYLLSRLDETLVEDLEIAPIAETDELVRLTQRHASCILLANAPRAIVEAVGSE